MIFVLVHGKKFVLGSQIGKKVCPDQTAHKELSDQGRLNLQTTTFSASPGLNGLTATGAV